jgi:hypothetical protein
VHTATFCTWIQSTRLSNVPKRKPHSRRRQPRVCSGAALACSVPCCERTGDVRSGALGRVECVLCVMLSQVRRSDITGVGFASGDTSTNDCNGSNKRWGVCSQAVGGGARGRLAWGVPATCSNSAEYASTARARGARQPLLCTRLSCTAAETNLWRDRRRCCRRARYTRVCHARSLLPAYHISHLRLVRAITFPHGPTNWPTH